MTSADDDRHVNTRRRLGERTADALLAGRCVPAEPELTLLMRQVRALADGPIPTPSTALAALLKHGFDPGAAPAPEPAAAVSWGNRAVSSTSSAVSWRGRSLALQLSLAGAACLALILGVAAAGDLPAPAQTAVADVIEAVTPLHLPRPAAAPSPSSVPEPAEATTSPSPEPAHPAAVTLTPRGDQSGKHPSNSRSSEPDSHGQSGDSGDQQGSDGPRLPRSTPTPSSSDNHGSVDRPESGQVRSGTSESGGSGGTTGSSSGESSPSVSGSSDSSGSGSGDSSNSSPGVTSSFTGSNNADSTYTADR